MYTPPHFAESDRNALAGLIAQHNFGTLIGQVNGRPYATHLPFLYDSDAAQLVAHMARANPHWQALAQASTEALVIFRGPHAYISPSWYADPGVPTWNYVAAHVYGHFKVIEDAAAHRAVLAELTRHHEGYRENAWVADFGGPPAAGMVKGTVAFRIEITEIVGKAKLSQNRSATDRENVIEQLSLSDSDAERGVAALMRERE